MNIDLGNAEVRAAILCEQVRPEIGNKMTVVGVFSADIMVPSFPATFLLSVYMELTIKTLGHTHYQVRFTSPTDTPAEAVLDLQASFDELGGSAVPMPQIPVTCERPGQLKIEIRVVDQIWHDLIVREVVAAPSA